MYVYYLFPYATEPNQTLLVIIKYFKPKPPSIQLPLDPSEPLNGPSRSSSARSVSRTSRHKSTSRARTIILTRTVEDHDHPHHTHAATRFDLTIARLSIFIEILVYIGLPLLGPIGFVVCSALSSFGAGFSPTVQSLALEFYRKRGGTETGRLYGGLSIVSALWYVLPFSTPYFVWSLGV